MIFIIVLVYRVVIKLAMAVKAQLDIIPSNSDNFEEQKTSLLRKECKSSPEYAGCKDCFIR